MASNEHIILSLLRLSRELSLSSTSNPLLRRHVSSVSRNSNLLSLFLEDLLTSSIFSRSSILALSEILVVYRKLKSFLADLSSWSRVRTLLYASEVSNQFNDITTDLATLLDILPLNDLEISEDVRDLVSFVRKQCKKSDKNCYDKEVDKIRSEMLDLIREVEHEIVPDRSKLETIFNKLGLDDTRSCGVEIECLEREIGEKVCPDSNSAMIALVGLVRYAKCVLFGASTPRSVSVNEFAVSFDSILEISIPDDFRCPITLELMKDPVVVASGQTYDKESIQKWIASGHVTCPKSGQALAHTDLVPNKALKNLIALWCRDQNIPFVSIIPTESENAVVSNKAALEAARMTALFLVKKLDSALSDEAVNRVVHELRQLSKNLSEIRMFVGDAGAIPLLITYLSSKNADLQVNAVTAVLNLSLLEMNKKRVMHTDGAVDAIVKVLTHGLTWQAKENAAATIVSLSAIHSYRKRLGRNAELVESLMNLANEGPVKSKKDALSAILSLTGERENIARLVKKNVVETALELISNPDLADESASILAGVIKRGGAQEVGAKSGVVMKLVRVLKNGSESAREHAAAALVVLCRKVGGIEMIGELVKVPGIEWVIWELMGSGTERGRRKAASLGRICRRWVAAAEEAERAVRYLSAVSVSESTVAET